jgi:hypothetical protein
MFLGFVSKWLTYPALTGTYFYIWQRLNGSDSNILFIFCIFLCAWSWLMIHNWKRQEAKVMVQWGYKSERLKERVRRQCVRAWRATIARLPDGVQVPRSKT